jgi:hypothetical protein
MGLQFGMGDQKMPNDCLERFGMGRDRFRVDRRNDAAGVRGLSRVAAIASDDAGYLRAHASRIVDCLDEIGADVQVAAANLEDEQRILGLQLADLQPLYEDRRARGQL